MAGVEQTGLSESVFTPACGGPSQAELSFCTRPCWAASLYRLLALLHSLPGLTIDTQLPCARGHCSPLCPQESPHPGQDSLLRSWPGPSSCCEGTGAPGSWSPPSSEVSVGNSGWTLGSGCSELSKGRVVLAGRWGSTHTGPCCPALHPGDRHCSQALV